MREFLQIFMTYFITCNTSTNDIGDNLDLASGKSYHWTPQILQNVILHQKDSYNKIFINLE